MSAFYESISEFNIYSCLLRLVLAVMMGGFIGSERGRHGRAAGLRTHILICVGATVTALTGLFVSKSFGGGDVLRISAQVISGIGFLGVGTILVRNNSIVTGLTTAAGLWTTAAIGIAVGYGFYAGSIAATAICIFTATVLTRLEKGRKNVVHFYAEISADESAGNTIEFIRKTGNADIAIDIISPKSNSAGRLGLVIDIHNANDPIEIKNNIEQFKGVCFVVDEAN